MPKHVSLTDPAKEHPVQIVHSSHRGSRDIEHLGSAHSDAEVELLKAELQPTAAATRQSR